MSSMSLGPLLVAVLPFAILKSHPFPPHEQLLAAVVWGKIRTAKKTYQQPKRCHRRLLGPCLVAALPFAILKSSTFPPREQLLMAVLGVVVVAMSWF